MTAIIAPDYQDFLKGKQLFAEPTGIDVSPDALHSSLKPHQRHTAVWALKQGRAAIFFDRGLGKTRTGLEWGRALINTHLQLKGFRVLIICPLAVVDEFLEEGRQINYLPKYAPDQSVVKRSRGIWLTNFERADRFDASQFDAVIIDEASILKSLDSKTRLGLTKQWRKTKFKLLLTATPSPNDVKELVNYSEFLGIMSRKEVFATFFINETSKEGKGTKLVTRLKHSAVEPFYRWLSSWAIAARKPSDLGFDDAGYDLPPLSIVEHEIESGWVNKGQLVYTKLSGVQERASLYKATQERRVQKALELVQSNNEQVIVWHLHNHEGYLLRDALGSDCVLVEGKLSAEAKTAAFQRFKRGEIRVLVTKPKIGGFGVNFQNSHRQVWVGINDSFESWYQAIGRQHRFGQDHPVQVDVILADAQRTVWDNVLRKKIDHENMIAQLVAHMGGTSQLARQRHEDYQTDRASGENWTLYQGDSCDPFGAMSQIEDNSIGISVHSPPFLARYAYTATERDLGNSRDKDEFIQHYRYQIRELLRVTMPGRSACVHVQNVRTTKRDTDTHPGLIDFRGEVIRAFVEEGWVWVHEVTVDKNAQAQAKRKHHQGLLYKTKNTDSSKLAGALADYLLVFRKPGDNPEPIWCDVPDEVWNWWARPVWYDISEIDVLDTQVAAADDDEMHLCPLQKPFIERCIRLWSNKGDLVLDPFNGISSTGWVAIEHGRKYVGIELKPNYFATGVKNLIEVERKMRQVDLFKWAGIEVEAKPTLNLPHLDISNNPLLKHVEKADSPVSELLEMEKSL